MPIPLLLKLLAGTAVTSMLCAGLVAGFGWPWPPKGKKKRPRPSPEGSPAAR